jgi:hypothetical protein
MIAPLNARLMKRDFEKAGERMTTPVWLNTFLVELGLIPKMLVRGILKAIGMGRTSSCLQNMRSMDYFEYE